MKTAAQANTMRRPGRAAVHQRLHRQQRDLRPRRRRAADRDVARRRHHQPRFAGAAEGVVIDREDALYGHARVEVERGIGAADLADTDRQILSVGAQGQRQPAT